MWPYAYDKVFFEVPTWKKKKSTQYVASQALYAFLVASVGASLRYCMSEHNILALCQGFLPRIIQTSLHLPLSLPFSLLFLFLFLNIVIPVWCIVRAVTAESRMQLRLHFRKAFWLFLLPIRLLQWNFPSYFQFIVFQNTNFRIYIK